MTNWLAKCGRLGYLIVGAALLGAAPTFASDFIVEPVVVNLSPQTPSTLLTISNRDSKSIRFEITGFAWSQDSQGQILLAPTDDVIFFPQLFTLGAGEKRKIRVGSSAPAMSVEKSYRIIVAEMPSLETSRSSTGIIILTRLGIPVFVQPAVAAVTGDISSLKVVNRTLTYQVQNGGNVHLVVVDTRIVGLDASGAAMFSHQAKGWYVLAGQTSQFDFPLSSDECAAAKSIQISIRTGDSSFSKSVPGPFSSCASAPTFAASNSSKHSTR